MPNGNGQGPANAGKMTGRGLGFCSGSGMPGRLNNTRQNSEDTVNQGNFNANRGPGCGAGQNAGGGGMRAGQGRRHSGGGNRRGR